MSAWKCRYWLYVLLAVLQASSAVNAQTVTLFSNTEAGVVEETYSVEENESLVDSANTGDAVGDGVTDDTSALQSVLDSGQTVKLGRNKTYRITRSLRIKHSNSGVRGAEGAKLLMGSEPGEFDNDIRLNRYNSNAIGILAGGVEGPFVEGVTIVYENNVDDRYVRAISFHTSSNISIRYNNISGFSKSLGIVYIGATIGGIVSYNEIHSSHTNSSTSGQITGIELDNDHLGSSNITISYNYIHDLTVGPQFLALYAYQTDGINPTTRSKRLTIVDNVIMNVGEGIDTFGSDSIISRNRIVKAHQFGIKLIHGASRNTVSENTIRKAGIAGIVLSGSTSVYQNTADNLIKKNRIIGINPFGVHRREKTFGISMNYVTSLSKIVRNRITGNFIDLGGTGAVGISAKLGAGTENEVRNNTVLNPIVGNYSLDRTVVPIFTFR